MALPYNPNLKTAARELRKHMTDAEIFIWEKVRRKQLKGSQFYRQKNIGDFIVDFYCPSARLIVEIDGGQHFTEEGHERDRARDRYLEGLGYKVLRFSDWEVFRDSEGVLEKIFRSL